jgi:hypothetical protein
MPASEPWSHSNLRLIGIIFTVVATASLLIGDLIITIIIVCSRRSIVGVGGGS